MKLLDRKSDSIIFAGHGGKAVEVFLCLFLIFVHSICLAGDPDSGYGTIIAIEFKVDNKSYNPPIVGHLEYTGSSINIVSIFEGIAGIGTLSHLLWLKLKYIERICL